MLFEQGPLRRPANADENVRQTFPQRTHHGVGHWHALAFGSSAEGVVYSNGRPVLRPLNAGTTLPPCKTELLLWYGLSFPPSPPPPS